MNLSNKLSEKIFKICVIFHQQNSVSEKGGKYDIFIKWSLSKCLTNQFYIENQVCDAQSFL